MACEGPQGPANQKAPVTGQNYKRQTQPPHPAKKKKKKNYVSRNNPKGTLQMKRQSKRSTKSS